MHRAESKIVVLAFATALAFAFHVGLEGVDVHVEHDKAFDFKPVKTWGWNPNGAGDVRMARTQQDDPVAMQKKVAPWILDAVATELKSRGLQQAATQPDVMVTYYLLLTTGMETQDLGQFLPPVAAWGLPPFAPATQSIKMMNQGALVLDLSAKGMVVWRGIAQASIKFEADDKKREALLREGVRDLLKRYPPRQ